jgi:putative heme-binding domain-containing protein
MARLRSILARFVRCALLGVIACGASEPARAVADAARPKKIVLLAGTVHQGPGGHPAGTHEYELSARLLKHALETAANISGVKAEVHVDGWPRDPRTLDDADTIVVLSDGADRNMQDHPLLVGDRLQVLKKQMDRGCGLVAIHWTVFVPRSHGGEEFLEWIGGYFDYESGNTPNKWFSKIQTASTTPKPAAPGHPICRGLAPFPLREEYYYGIRFRQNDPRLTPILSTSIPGETQEQIVAWAVERDSGGRGFGFTGGHFFENWGVEHFRRMVLNAILWTAHAEVPTGGVQTAAPTVEPVVAAGDKPIQALIVTGHQYPGHLWRETTPALQDALGQDRRFQITVVTDPEFLASKNLFGYDVMVLNYCNWQRAGLSDEAKANFQKYLSDGGGLVIIHFANGAFHASLPEAPSSDWPEYRNICRRVWDHAPGRSGHDPYSRFRVTIAKDHPITSVLNSFETIDELYCNQQGDAPIEVLATAHSTITGRDEPMAFVYSYGKGRVFQTVLGHAAESIRVPGAAALIRRAAVWASGQPQRAIAARVPPAVSVAPKLVPEGRFGAALDPRQGAAWCAHQESYDRLPLTVECWARLTGKTGFNILVANNPKESAEHWEIFTVAGSGHLSLFLPGFAPQQVDSNVDIVDDQWHFVCATLENERVSLAVDGKLVQRTPIARHRSGGPSSPLHFGGYPPQGLRCDGFIDEVRISKAVRTLDGIPTAPLAADDQTIGLWHFDRIESGKVDDASAMKNPAVAGARQESASPLLTRRTVDPDWKLVSIDASPDESFLSMRCDTTGRLFVGGREALFAYEPDAHGGYRPRQLLYRFPPDSWITDVEIRGDDLYVMTNAALYLIHGGRIAREGLKPRRLLWGTPVDLHVTWHGLAWGPEGDLYFSSGDPLLNYGDFQNRPDHWGHFTIYTQPEGTKIPYTGMGGFFRVRPDGSGFQVVANGTRGAVGLAFDRRWNLFSNDNDHESIAERYSPARLLHVAPRAHFFWPRGWIASMSPERSDLLEIANTGLGREAPVGQTYYDETWLGPKIRDSVILARWGQRKVDGFTLAPRGASFRGQEYPLLAGDETARPVGVTVGRGGRIFVALAYMAANEWSPRYPAELVMITRADDSADYPFESYDAVSVDAERLWQDLSNRSWERRRQAHAEILRRGGDLLIAAVARLKAVGAGDPALMHLPWLAAASGRPEARAALVALLTHRDANVRVQAVRALAEFRRLAAPGEVFVQALEDDDPQVQHAGIVALFDRQEAPLPESLFSGPARSQDTYLRQASAFLIAQRGSTVQRDRLLASSDAAERLAGVLAAGFRLTVPPTLGPVPPKLPLSYESGNALFVIQYADATVDLKKLGRVGSFTTAERWKAVPPSDDEQRLFKSLIGKLNDADDRVRVQAGYFLSLLNDPPTNQLIAQTQRSATLRRLAAVLAAPIKQAWQIGPFDDGSAGFATVHPPEQGAIDLSATWTEGSGKLTWQSLATDGDFRLPNVGPPVDRASSYLYFRLQTLEAQQVALALADAKDRQLKLSHNGRAIEGPSPFVISLDPGSNDILVRVGHGQHAETISLPLQATGRVEVALPEKLGLSTLAERLKNAGDSASSVPAEFLSVDWASAARTGDAERGRRLFGADALGCVKCHAIVANQKGGGAPSLAGAAARFTVSHLVESILLPNKQVAPVFGTTSLVTTDGKTHSGLVVEENDEQVVLLLPTAARQAVAKTDIEARKLQPVSPMPSGLVKTADELRDLLAYLLTPNPRIP